MTYDVDINRSVETHQAFEVVTIERIFHIGEADVFLVKEAKPFDGLVAGPSFISIDRHLHIFTHGLAYNLQPAQVTLRIRVPNFDRDRFKALPGEAAVDRYSFFFREREIQSASIGQNTVLLRFSS